MPLLRSCHRPILCSSSTRCRLAPSPPRFPPLLGAAGLSRAGESKAAACDIASASAPGGSSHGQGGAEPGLGNWKSDTTPPPHWELPTSSVGATRRFDHRAVAGTGVTWWLLPSE